MRSQIPTNKTYIFNFQSVDKLKLKFTKLLKIVIASFVYEYSCNLTAKDISTSEECIQYS